MRRPRHKTSVYRSVITVVSMDEVPKRLRETICERYVNRILRKLVVA